MSTKRKAKVKSKSSKPSKSSKSAKKSSRSTSIAQLVKKSKPKPSAADADEANIAAATSSTDSADSTSSTGSGRRIGRPRKPKPATVHIRLSASKDSDTMCGGSHSPIWNTHGDKPLTTVGPQFAAKATCGRCLRVNNARERDGKA